MPGGGSNVFNPSIQEVKTGESLEFEASPLYRVSSKTPRAMRETMSGGRGNRCIITSYVGLIGAKGASHSPRLEKRKMLCYS